MKKILLTFILALASYFSYSQYVVGGLSGIDSAYHFTYLNAPNNDTIGILKDSSYIKWITKKFYITNVGINTKDSTSYNSNSSIVGIDSNGLTKNIPIKYIPLTSNQIIKGLGYTPAQPNSPTFNPSVTRPINSTTYTVSTTKNARVYYTISIGCSASIGSNASGSVTLQYSTDGGTTWNSIGQVVNSNQVTLAVVIGSTTNQTTVLTGEIPANALVRMVQTITGTTSITYIGGAEILY